MKYDFQFLKNTPDVTIYHTGRVRFSADAVKRFGLAGTAIRWGIDEANNAIAFRKDETSKHRLSGKQQDITCCPINLARRFIGKYDIEQLGAEYVLINAEKYLKK